MEVLLDFIFEKTDIKVFYSEQVVTLKYDEHMTSVILFHTHGGYQSRQLLLEEGSGGSYSEVIPTPNSPGGISLCWSQLVILILIVAFPGRDIYKSRA